MSEDIKRQSIENICASLSYAMGIDVCKCAEAPSDLLCRYIDEAFGGEKADRVFMFNPDAIAEWIYKKYPELFKEVEMRCELHLPLNAVMPSVTPVCFGTMYTGASPDVHGIKAYVKPVITIDTLFDALIRAGKRATIVADSASSLAKIYLERDMDYFVYDTVEEVNAKAAELILRDEHDLIVVYNKNYDSTMHRVGPEGIEALAEIKANSRTFGMFSDMIAKHWKDHNTLVGFAMDHGCHEIDGGAGSHGLDMEEDMHIVHLYKAYKAEK